MIEYKKHYRHWKAIQEAFPSLSLEEIKGHANAFFDKINSIRPRRVSMLDFVRKNPIEYFKEITFDRSSKRIFVDDKEGLEDRELGNSIQKNQSHDPYEEEKHQQENKRSEECKHSIEEMKMEQMRQEQRGGQNHRYMPTQSKVMTDALKVCTTEMMKLMQSLVKDLQVHGEEIQKYSNAAGYWGYLYNSAVYLQQIINDVTVAHNSTLTFMQETKMCFGQSDNLN